MYKCFSIYFKGNLFFFLFIFNISTFLSPFLFCVDVYGVVLCAYIHVYVGLHMLTAVYIYIYVCVCVAQLVGGWVHNKK